jgi:hypothetical protein
MNEGILYWDLAHRLDVARESPDEFGNGPIYKMAQLDGGIKFFILALEELGAKTRYSCEGHPYGAYVAFDAPVRLIRSIHFTNTFTLVADLNEMRLDGMCDCAMYADHKRHRTGQDAALWAEAYTEEMRVDFLRQAADQWMRRFGYRLPKLRQQLEALAAQIPLEQQLYNQQQGAVNGNSPE